MEIIQASIIFTIALIALLKSADYFTNASEKIGAHFRIPPFVIGVTIIALGTSLPEIVTSVIAVNQNHSEIVIGNVVGSNIANILLVLGISAIVGKKIKITKDIINIDLPILLASTIFLYITTLEGSFNFKEGILAMIGLSIYLIYNANSEKIAISEEVEEIKKLEKTHFDKKQPIILLISGLFLYISATYTVSSVIQIAEILNIGKEIIAISAIALGTSLPELAVSITAIKQGKADMAIGNITGSNIFNALGVMGIASFFGNLHIPAEIISFTIPTLMLITILYIFVTMEKSISKWEGATLILLYVTIIAKSFGAI